MQTGENDDFFSRDRGWRFEQAGVGMLRITLLFGSAVVALALMIVPMLERNRTTIASSAGLDVMSTGTIGSPSSAYTIRRSVLQPSPTSVCIIRPNGRRSGDC